MSNLTLTAQWHDTINQVETSEPIIGGAEGNANLATKQLAESLLWLKSDTQQKIDNLPEPSPDAGFTQNLSDTGYCQLPNGMIMQWGKNDTATYSENTASVQFPMPFPTACLNVTATPKTTSADGDNSDGGLAIYSYDATSAAVHLMTFYGNNSGSLRGFTWFAIGY